MVTSATMAAAFAVILAGPVARAPRRAGGLTSFAVVRTKADVHAGRQLRFDDGTFCILDGGREAVASEADVEHIVFIPRLDAPSLNTAVGLAFRIAIPERLKRFVPRRGDLYGLLLRSGGIFFLPSDDVSSVFPRFVRALGEPELTGVLCHELVRVLQKRQEEEQAVRLLGAAEKEHEGTERGFVCAIIRVALLKSMNDPRTKDEMRRLFERYRDQRGELLRFRTLIMGEIPRRPGRNPPNGRPGPRP